MSFFGGERGRESLAKPSFGVTSDLQFAQKKKSYEINRFLEECVNRLSSMAPNMIYGWRWFDAHYRIVKKQICNVGTKNHTSTEDSRIVDKKGQQQATVVVVCLVAECQKSKALFLWATSKLLEMMGLD